MKRASRWFGTLLFILPEIALALDKDFYTYNTFIETVDAFKRMALIFGNPTYNLLFSSVAVMGILIAGFVTYGRGLAGQKINPLGFAVPVLAGVMLYQGLIIPKGTITIYDKTVNSTETVAGVPDGLVITAWLFNRIEYYFIYILDNSTANGWDKFQEQAGGISFKLMDEVARMFKDPNDTYLTKSLDRYVKDCGAIPLAIGTVDVNEIRRTTNWIVDVLAKFISKANMTIYYSNADKAGSLVSCESAWSSISAVLSNTTTIEPMLKQACVKGGFDINHVTQGTNQLTRCKSLIAAAGQLQGNVSASSEDMIKNLYIGQVILEAIGNGDIDLATQQLTNRNTMTQSLGASQSINEWMPRIRGFMLTVILALIPITALFIVTPLVGKAVMVTLGMIVWYTAWSIVDAAMHQSAMDVAFRAFNQLSNSNGGLDTVWLMPEATSQALGIFGTARLVAFTLAGVITAALFKFNVGSSLSSIGSQALGKIAATGAQAATNTGTLEGQGELLRSTSAGAGMASNYSQHGFNSMASANAYHESMNISTANQQIAGGVNRGLKLHDTAAIMGAMNAGRSIGQMSAAQTLASMHGATNSNDFREFLSGLESTSSLRSMMGTQAYKAAIEKQFPEVKGNQELFAEKTFQAEFYNNYDNLSLSNATGASIGEVTEKMADRLIQRGVEPTLAYQVANKNYQDMYHNEKLAKAQAHDLNGSQAFDIAAYQLRKNTQQTLGEKNSLGTDADQVNYSDGQLTAARGIGGLTAVENNYLSDIANGHFQEITTNAEQAKVLDNAAYTQFGGDFKGMQKQLAETETSARVAENARNRYLADMFFGGDIQSTLNARDMMGGYHVPTNSLLSAINDHPQLYSSITPQQLAILQTQDSVHLEMAFNPGTGQVSNIRLFGGSQTAVSHSSELDNRNELRSGSQSDAVSMSHLLLSQNANDRQAMRVQLATAFSPESNQGVLHNVASSWASAIRLQAESTSSEYNNVGWQAGIGTGGASSALPKNMLQTAAKMLGVNADASLSGSFNDNISYDQIMAGSLSKLREFDQTARYYANQHGNTEDEKSELYAAHMDLQMTKIHRKLTNAFQDEAIDSLTASPLNTIMDKATNPLDNRSGQVIRDTK